MPIRYLVSRHAAAITWIKQQTQVDQAIDHFDSNLIQPGDTVIGTLPVHIAAEVCERGGKYLHLELTIPSEQRGKELSLEEMSACNPTLTYFQIMQKKENKL
jgi:CRISPR-associated protein Csx16